MLNQCLYRKRYFILAVVVVIMTCSSALLYLSKMRQTQHARMPKMTHQPPLTLRDLQKNNLLFKNDAQLAAALPEEKEQAATEFLEALAFLPDDDIFTLKEERQRALKIQQQERERRRVKLALYQNLIAKWQDEETREIKQEAWQTKFAVDRKRAAAFLQKAKEFLESQAIFDEYGDVRAINVNGTFVPIESLYENAEIGGQSEGFFSSPSSSVEPVENSDVANDNPKDVFTQQQEVSEDPDITVIESETFTPGIFRETITLQVSIWSADIDGQYLDVILTPYLTETEFEEFFPTEESQQMLQARKQQMQADITERVERFLVEDTHGNRDQKLSIIRETLSQNWGEEIANNVVKDLQ
ncbi:MAG: hypothetical protein OXH00_01465 [Candidatus Poribacteria bacterium]|nr:hypothetical protein [Candidatus Poribacteria bacterium]